MMSAATNTNWTNHGGVPAPCDVIAPPLTESERAHFADFTHEELEDLETLGDILDGR